MVMHGTNSKLTELLTKLLEESSDTSKTTGQFYFLTNDLYQMISKSQNGWMIAKNFTPIEKTLSRKKLFVLNVTSILRHLLIFFKK